MVPDRSPRKLIKLISTLTLDANTTNPSPFWGSWGVLRCKGREENITAVRVIGVLSRYYVHLLLLIETEACFRMHACHKINAVES